MCPSECKTRFVSQCSPQCNYGECGDSYVDVDGADNSVGTSDDEECDMGLYCPDGVSCTHDESLCPGECISRNTDLCTLICQIPECGDTVITTTINSQTVRDCSAFDNRCGDGVVDPDGADNIENTADDEECDDGNLANNDGCSVLCSYEFSSTAAGSCQNGITDGTET